jgi:hypothetical protein
MRVGIRPMPAILRTVTALTWTKISSTSRPATVGTSRKSPDQRSTSHRAINHPCCQQFHRLTGPSSSSWTNTTTTSRKSAICWSIFIGLLWFPTNRSWVTTSASAISRLMRSSRRRAESLANSQVANSRRNCSWNNEPSKYVLLFYLFDLFWLCIGVNARE